MLSFSGSPTSESNQIRDGRNGLQDGETRSQEGAVSITEPLHQLHDPVDYHSQANPTIQSPHDVSEPNHELHAHVIANRRNGSGPPHLGTGIYSVLRLMKDFVHRSAIIIMAASKPDKATQALIAQLMAENFSEAYAD